MQMLNATQVNTSILAKLSDAQVSDQAEPSSVASLSELSASQLALVGGGFVSPSW